MSSEFISPKEYLRRNKRPLFIAHRDTPEPSSSTPNDISIPDAPDLDLPIPEPGEPSVEPSQDFGDISPSIPDPDAFAPKELL